MIYTYTLYDKVKRRRAQAEVSPLSVLTTLSEHMVCGVGRVWVRSLGIPTGAAAARRQREQDPPYNFNITYRVCPCVRLCFYVCIMYMDRTHIYCMFH